MKLYRLGQNEIRICLTQEDLGRYCVTAEDFDYDSSKGRRVFRELFDLAKEETGFDAAKEKVYIQLYPKKNGGCEIFVTKLEKECDATLCYLIEGADTVFAVSKLFCRENEARLFRCRDGKRFFLITSACTAPPALSEFAQRLSRLPSEAYLKSRCKEICLDRFRA